MSLEIIIGFIVFVVLVYIMRKQSLTSEKVTLAKHILNMDDSIDNHKIGVVFANQQTAIKAMASRSDIDKNDLAEWIKNTLIN